MRNIRIEEGRLYGYTGKILRIDLTRSRAETIPTTRYVPRYVGGRAVSNRIFWEEVGPGVKAYDPENKLIFMTGATTGTGIPASARLSVTGISPNSLPEMYCHSNMGGFFSAMLKYAGYDGLIVEGRAPKHTYVYIEDDRVEFLEADGFIWGGYTHETQEKLREKHGSHVQCLVIGPAGENLHRNASITNNNDSASAKGGYGAVFGAKNLKAVVVKGTKAVRAAHVDSVLKLHKTVGYPSGELDPLTRKTVYGGYKMTVDAPEGWLSGRLCCGYGCDHLCMNTCFDAYDPLHEGGRVAEVIKCMDAMGCNFTYDTARGDWNNVHSRRQEDPRGEVFDPLRVNTDYEQSALKAVYKGSYTYNRLRINDPDDPLLSAITTQYTGDKCNYYGPNLKRGHTFSVLCTQYGLDKWDIMLWYFTWLSAAKQEGLLEDLDLGMEVDVESEVFAKHFIDDMTYRKTPMGEIFAEGMARAMRTLGKEKYGDAIYHGRYDQLGEKQLDVPCSIESGWGHCSHYQGRGFEGCPKYAWLIYSLVCMADSRDAVCSQHLHSWAEDYVQYKDDPCHSRLLAQVAMHDEITGHLKDSLVACEWKSPNMGWPDMESQMYTAATGLEVSMEDLEEMAMESMLLFRAIQMRDHGRYRDMEVEEMYPFLTYPDPYGETVTWDEWNDLVDLFYQVHGWDVATGWPFRSTWEAHGLKDVADELERLGLLPPEGGTPGYIRKEDPFGRG